MLWNMLFCLLMPALVYCPVYTPGIRLDASLLFLVLVYLLARARFQSTLILLPRPSKPKEFPCLISFSEAQARMKQI
jgi:hypothetical protein